MLERQRVGIEIAVKNGAYKGRQEIDYPSNWVAVYNKYKNKELKANEAMVQLDLRKTTFINW